MLVKEKVALVTGSSTGIGAGIAAALAREGADVVVNYRSNAEGARANAGAVCDEGCEAHIVQADVSVLANVERLTDAAVERFGRIDILHMPSRVRDNELYGLS
jgi:NAD(P)-dependent dehydrogenase (short-subunit alcohol dehydrogenase family)